MRCGVWFFEATMRRGAWSECWGAGSVSCAANRNVQRCSAAARMTSTLARAKVQSVVLCVAHKGLAQASRRELELDYKGTRFCHTYN